MRETTRETIDRVNARGDQDRRGYDVPIAKVVHYETPTLSGAVGHGVRFHYADGTVADYPPHHHGT